MKLIKETISNEGEEYTYYKILVSEDQVSSFSYPHSGEFIFRNASNDLQEGYFDYILENSPYLINVVYDSNLKLLKNLNPSEPELEVLLEYVEYIDDFQVHINHNGDVDLAGLISKIPSVELDDALNISNAHYLVNDITIRQIVKILDRDFKVFKFNISEAISLFSDSKNQIKNKNFILTTEDNSSFHEVEFEVIKKRIWKRKCWESLNFPGIRKRKESNKEMIIKSSRVLVFFQGLSKNRTGFYDLLSREEYLKQLEEIYGNDIYLLTYPTWFVNLQEKIDFLQGLFNALNTEGKVLDFICTSTGCLVGRGLVNQLSDSIQINSIYCINGPNTGTPVAEATNISYFFKIIGFYPDPLLKLIAKFGEKLIGELVGVMDLEGQSSKIVEINKRYNLLNRNLDYFIGTEFKEAGGVFKNKPNDKIIPVASMKGQFLVDASYNYEGPEIQVDPNNILIVSKKEGGRQHGKQYLNLRLTNFIINKLVENNIYS